MTDTSAPPNYMRALRRSSLVLIAFGVLGGAVGLGITLKVSEGYRADTQMFVAWPQPFGPPQLPHSYVNTTQLTPSYAAFATSPAVTDLVVRQLRLGITPQQLAGKISADSPSNTVLINIHVTDHDPATAAKLANAVSQQLATVVEHVPPPTAHGKPAIKVTVIHPAAVPANPYRPDMARNIGLGVLGGLLVGGAVVIVRAK